MKFLYYIILYLSLLISIRAMALESSCTIELPDKLIVINEIPSKYTKDIFNKTNCSTNLNKAVYNLIKGLKGKFKSKFIVNEIKEETNQVVNLSPAEISIIYLNQKIKMNYPQLEKYKVDIEDQIRPRYLKLKQNEDVSINCNNCNNLGTHSIELFYKTAVYKKTYQFHFKVKKRIQIYQTKRTMNYTNNPSAEDFIIKSIYTTSPNIYPQAPFDLEKYNLKHFLPKGSHLKFSDLAQQFVIDQGKKVNVVLQNKGLKISTYGIAQKKGRIGDFIPIYSYKYKTQILGKIISPDRVMVNL